MLTPKQFDGEALQLPPRGAGEPMWASMVEEHERKLAALILVVCLCV